MNFRIVLDRNIFRDNQPGEVRVTYQTVGNTIAIVTDYGFEPEILVRIKDVPAAMKAINVATYEYFENEKMIQQQ